MGFTFHFERIASSEGCSVCRLYMVQPNGKRIFLTRGWVSYSDCVEVYRAIKAAVTALQPLCGFSLLAPTEAQWEAFNAAPQVNR